MTRRIAIVRLGSYPQDMLVRREAEALKEAGFEVHVFCLRARQAAEDVINSVHVHRLPLQRKKRGVTRNLFEYMAFFLLATFRLTSFHIRHPLSAIQVNSMPDFLVFSTLFPRLLGAGVTLLLYEPMPELWMSKFKFAFPIRLMEKIQQAAIRYAHLTLTVTQTMKDRLISRGADPDRIKVILNVPDVRLFGETFPAGGAFHDRVFTLVYHGAIEERYGHDTLLQAMAQVRGQIPGLRLRILGDGSHRNEILALMKRLGLQEQVQYLGFVPVQELVRELHQADVGIIAMKASPYSHLIHTGKMYDYLAFGKPVIASRLKAVQSYFDEESLLFFKPGDATDLARAILALYRNPEKRRALTENSGKRYDQLKWERQKNLYTSVYHHLVGEPTMEF